MEKRCLFCFMFVLNPVHLSLYISFGKILRGTRKSKNTEKYKTHKNCNMYVYIIYDIYFGVIMKVLLN